jgi:solute carrier family 25 (mitochondrial carnitine/acylcarnitine transporter), member 20/29
MCNICTTDVIKSRLQIQHSPSSPEELSLLVHRKNYSTVSPTAMTIRESYTGIVDCAAKSYHAEGIAVFFRGIIPTLVRAWPVNAVTFYVYELMINWLNGLQHSN